MSDRATGWCLLASGGFLLFVGFVVSALDWLIGASLGGMGCVGVAVGIAAINRENTNDEGEGRS